MQVEGEPRNAVIVNNRRGFQQDIARKVEN